MNKTAIKNFAIWARKKLIADITYKAGLLGISEKGIKSPLSQSTQNVQFFDIGTKDPYSISDIEVKQRDVLVETISNKAKSSDYATSYKAVLEEVAYTWFNRLIAVRFMEINDYLPSRIRVLSSESATKNEPDLVTRPFDTDLEFSPYEKDRIVQLTHETKYDELFRMLFIKQCNALNAILPNLFEKTSDFTELLLNVSITDKDGVVYHLVHDIAEDDFNVSKEGQIEIIGWMYQYYNTEPKDEVFALLKSNVKITKERIPAATQLFTPDWIVRYMVENSLGRLWLEGHPNDTLKSGWKYYLDEAEQEAKVQKQLDTIRVEYKTIKPEDIKFIDPCMGSGHILVYAFDVLMQIYECAGYSQRDAAKKIIEHNIYGLDIDNRAYQLSYFAVMMKARQYNRRILNDTPDFHLYSIQESNGINRRQLQYFGVGMNELERNIAVPQLESLLDTFIDAKEYGSILNVDSYNWAVLYQFVGNVYLDGQMAFEAIGIEDTKAQLHAIVEIGAVMAQKYDVVVTNPPYMGINNGNWKLNDFVKKYYPNSKSDLYAVFIEKCNNMTNVNRFQSMITQHSWMFLSSFELLRKEMCHADIISMAHLGARAFEEISGEVVQTSSFVLSKRNTPNYESKYKRLVEFNNQKSKENAFLSEGNLYLAKKESFSLIPGAPVAYWISSSMLNAFTKGKLIGEIGQPKQGSTLGDNATFLRYWFEISGFSQKWVKCMKGGAYRKWYGNMLHVLDWENNGSRIKSTGRATIRSERLLFRKGVTWSNIASVESSFRYMEEGYFFESTGSVCFIRDDLLNYLLAFLNTPIVNTLSKIINPTLHLQSGDVAQFPLIIDPTQISNINSHVDNCVLLSKNDWDNFELSWNFVKHPLLKMINTDNCKIETFIEQNTLESAFNHWRISSTKQFYRLKTEEEELNRIFIKLYGLQNEMIPDVDDNDIAIRKADLGRDIRSFISYAVGCMFGRYSIDADGLVYPGNDWNGNRYNTIIPVEDNILPITDEEYFDDDIVNLFTIFMRKTFSDTYLEQNLEFIARALNNKGSNSREIIRNYFVKDFFKDHCRIYQKRPIYWLFDSGKADGFKALVYIHRYDENTIGNLRIDYLHRMQRIYDSEISRMQETIENSSNAREIVVAETRKEKLKKQIKETKEYDVKIAHLALARISIDLDDGVVSNYEKVQTDAYGKILEVLAKF